MLEIGMTVPLLCLRHHHNLDVISNQVVNQILTGTEMLGFQGADHKNLGTFVLHVLNQGRTVVPYKSTHQIFRIFVLVGSNKTNHLILHRVLVLDTLGQTYSTGMNTINKHTLSKGILSEKVIKALYSNTHSAHE